MSIYMSMVALLFSPQVQKELPIEVLQKAEALIRRLSEAKEGTAMDRALRQGPTVWTDPKFPSMSTVSFIDPKENRVDAHITFDIQQMRFRSFLLSGRSVSRRSERTMTPESAMAKAEEVYRLLGGQAQLRIRKATGLYEPQSPDNPDLILVPDVHGPTPIFLDDVVEIEAYQVINKIPFTTSNTVGFRIDMKTGRVEWMSIPVLPGVAPLPSRILSKLECRSIAEREVSGMLKGLQFIEKQPFQLWYWDDSIDLASIQGKSYRPEWRTRPARLVYEGTYTDTDGDRGVRIAYDAVTGEQLGRISFNRNSGFGSGGHRKPLAPFTFDLDAGSITVRSQEKETVVRGAVARSGTPSRIPTNSVPMTLERGRLRLLVDFYPELGLLRTGTQWGRPDAPLLKSLTEFATRRPSG